MKDTTSSLAPSPHEQVARAVGDLCLGLPCLVSCGQKRAIIMSVETLQQSRLDALIGMHGTPELGITSQRAKAITAEPTHSSIAAGIVRVRPPENARLIWFKDLANPHYDAAILEAEPLDILRDGDSTVHELAIELVKKAELLPAAIVFFVAAGVPVSDFITTSLDTEVAMSLLSNPLAPMPVAAAKLPLAAHDVSQLTVFRDPDGKTEHYAIEIGMPDRSAPVLARLHSACFTGDVLGSLKCDCGPQLQAALTIMGDANAGILLYLNQEGRGIGLANKMRVYSLQTQGLDTVEANHRLGFKDDERDFRIAAQILQTLDFHSIRLLTNNPAKVEAFKSCGITIAEQLPLRIASNAHNQNYLATKAQKSGHLL